MNSRTVFINPNALYCTPLGYPITLNHHPLKKFSGWMGKNVGLSNPESTSSVSVPRTNLASIIGMRRLSNLAVDQIDGVQFYKIMNTQVHEDAKNRLARISGQVNGIQKMVEEGRYCVDILTQVSALRGALDQFGLLMLTTHLENCVYGADTSDGSQFGSMSHEERLAEIKVTLNRFLK